MFKIAYSVFALSSLLMIGTTPSSALVEKYTSPAHQKACETNCTQKKCADNISEKAKCLEKCVAKTLLDQKCVQQHEIDALKKQTAEKFNW